MGKVDRVIQGTPAAFTDDDSIASRPVWDLKTVQIDRAS
jgi:hypothetical protein